MHFQTVEVPRLRLVGFFLNAIAVILHNWLVQDRFSIGDTLYVSSVLIGYALVAWTMISVFWSPTAAIDISDFFLVFDVVVFAFIVYVSGADRSLMWIIFIARPADQVATTYRRPGFNARPWLDQGS